MQTGTLLHVPLAWHAARHRPRQVLSIGSKCTSNQDFSSLLVMRCCAGPGGALFVRTHAAHAQEARRVEALLPLLLGQQTRPPQAQAEARRGTLAETALAAMTLAAAVVVASSLQTAVRQHAPHTWLCLACLMCRACIHVHALYRLELG